MERGKISKPFWETLPAKVEPSAVRRSVKPERRYMEELLGASDVEYSATKVPPPQGNSYEEVLLGIPKQRVEEDDGIDRTGPKVPYDKLHEITLWLNK